MKKKIILGLTGSMGLIFLGIESLRAAPLVIVVPLVVLVSAIATDSLLKRIIGDTTIDKDKSDKRSK